MKQLYKQRGMSLIELMIAGLLSLVISYFIMNIMINSTKSATTSDGLAEAQETGRFVMSFLSKEIQRAGYKLVRNLDPSAPFADLCPTGTALPPADNADCTFDSDGNDSGDRLAIRWQYNVSSTLARDQEDCAGVALAVPDETNLVDVYWIESDINNGDGYNDVLRCVTYNEGTGKVVVGSSAQTIASGIVAMHVLYGTFNVTGATVTNSRYMSGNQFAGPDWSLPIRSARVYLLTRSFNPNTLDNNTRGYVLANARPYQLTDQVSRYIQVSTVALSNLNTVDNN